MVLSIKIKQSQQESILNEIIDNAAGLPVESQDLLLMIAKAMRYTRNSIICHSSDEQSVPGSISEKYI